MLTRLNNNQYSYFDHIVESQIDLPELYLLDKPDVFSSIYINIDERTTGAECRHDWCHHWKTIDGVITLSLAKDNNAFFLEVPGSVRFEISGDGKQLLCNPEPSTPLITTRHLLLDQILPRMFAHFHGYNVFHGSCVAIADTGICFLGETGRGKSTLAAGFLKAGYTVLTDDCLSISVHNGSVVGIPSYKGIRLLKDSFAALNFEDPGENLVEPAFNEKSRISLPHLATTNTELKKIFLLTDPNGSITCKNVEKIEVSKSLAVKELLKNSFSLDIYDSRYLKNQFLQIVSLVSTGIPIYLLRYPRSFQALPQIIEAIEKVK